ncbi:MAG: PilZ domain-containing protein [Thermodesulfobacteriota bacterium]
MTEAKKVTRKLEISPLADELIDNILELPPEHQRDLLTELKSRRGGARRKYSRQPYRDTVQFSADGKVFNGFFKNVSNNGAFVETLESDLQRLESGRQVTIAFEHPYNSKYIKLDGEIARTSQNGIGIRFYSLL